MIWYEIKKCKDLYVVFKNVENHGVASKCKFRGLKKECEIYCEQHDIKLGIENAIKIS